jgi:hypothetical protein
MIRVHSLRSTALMAPILGLLALMDAPTGSAQTVVLDEGTFEIFLGGRGVGTESFTIRREGSGAEAVVLANATVSMDGDHRSVMRPVVKTDLDRSPVQYTNTIEGDDQSAVSLDYMGRHYRVRVSSAAGELEREVPVRPGTVLLEAGVAHHYWFISALTERQGASIVAVIPRTGEQARLRVVSVTTDAVVVGGERVEARKVDLTEGSDPQSVWFDGEGRVLRVEIPATGYRAVRVGR